MDSHNELVNTVVERIRDFHERKVPFKIYHGSTNSTRDAGFQRDKIVDTSKLDRVLKVDTTAKTALVEPNVGMDRLVEETGKCGLVPEVVMEFPGITAGGGFVGMAGESSSFRYGFFNQTANWIEVVLANGELVKASPTENQDLFRGASGSFGTLGVLTLLEIRLVERRRFVEVTYDPVSSIPEAVAKIEDCRANKEVEYVDAILYSANSGVIVTGRQTDGATGLRKQGFLKSTDPWFYLHAKKILKKNKEKPTKELVPIEDYLFRYDRGAFWTGEYAFKWFVTPFNRITRWALDHFMHTRVMYHALHKSGHSKQYIIQDLAIPVSRVQDFIQYVDDSFGIYPLWLCPLREDGKYAASPNGGKDSILETNEHLLNVGVWGPGPTKYPEFVEKNREMESKVREFGGVKWLYAQAFYTEEEFWSIYDRQAYDELRAKYHASNLPTVYSKTNAPLVEPVPDPSTWRGWLRHKTFGVWPISGVYGVVSTVLSKEYLLKK
ncbi:FAD-binding domain-containing protein [Pseudovirgaria hyperparasitica]|uniref:Delta(24)-sterol reductase n=1 Tax=Pseudovirgaria hyperparasitica TaxID=470096 RepID=A0A6A6VY55_9PEZI|nr:FAD-binding domain-containing protein [Pseudovirgaria hyperparasitica]KAF2754580.1 FAD-binding domain-containing protein [Pseudovirgaria hyperparasitica]